jgi:hypothetical protein
MIEVVVYLDKNYLNNKSIWVNNYLSKKEITEIVNKKFKSWHSYDIMSSPKK